jgi:predicted DNA-binding transcriptional regulator AlpA
MSWQQYYLETLQMYPNFVTVKQVMKICNVTKKTAYKYIHSGNINYKMDKRMIYVELASLLKFLYTLKCMGDEEEPLTMKLRLFYADITKDYPDILTVPMVATITGYAKSSVQRWISQKDLEAFIIRRKFIVPKPCLIDFMISQRFRAIVVKSERHIELINQFNTK